MADYTKNKKLELPKSNERYDVAVANKNNMVIDSELNKLDLKNQSQDTQIDEAIAHKNNNNNPHNVTKDQLELGNVDNTSDADKPVSIDQQRFINYSVTSHNESELSHSDIRETLSDLSTRLNTLADSDDETLDQLSEIVSYIKNNKTLIDGITTSKVNVSDIISTTDLLQSNTVSGKIVDALLVKDILQSSSSNTSSVLDTNYIQNYVDNFTFSFTADNDPYIDIRSTASSNSLDGKTITGIDLFVCSITGKNNEKINVSGKCLILIPCYKSAFYSQVYAIGIYDDVLYIFPLDISINYSGNGGFFASFKVTRNGYTVSSSGISDLGNYFIKDITVSYNIYYV